MFFYVVFLFLEPFWIICNEPQIGYQHAQRSGTRHNCQAPLLIAHYYSIFPHVCNLQNYCILQHGGGVNSDIKIFILLITECKITTFFSYTQIFDKKNIIQAIGIIMARRRKVRGEGGRPEDGNKDGGIPLRAGQPT